jgi:hypothetical protein
MYIGASESLSIYELARQNNHGHSILLQFFNVVTYQCNNMNPSWKSLDKNVIQIVVSNHPCRFEIQWDKRLVVPVILIAILIREFRPMSRIMQKNGIPRFALTNNVLVGGNDVGLCGKGVVSVVS